MTDFNLPKWPQMRVIGKSIDPAYAMEIIRRTDSFFSSFPSGNNKQWVEWVEKTVRLPNSDDGGDYLTEFIPKMNKWQEDWGCVSTEYVHNTWVSSAFVYGPNGWCHPDGTIYYEYNVGKWPSSDELIEEWTKIAHAFPGLHLDAVFMDGERTEETSMIFAILVRDQEIYVHGPEQYELYWAAFGQHEYPEAWRPRTEENQLIKRFDFNNPYREIGISDTQIKAWADKFLLEHPEHA